MIGVLLLVLLLVIVLFVIGFITWRMFRSERDTTRKLNRMHHRFKDEVDTDRVRLGGKNGAEISVDGSTLDLRSPKKGGGVRVEGTGLSVQGKSAPRTILPGLETMETRFASTGVNTVRGDVVVGGGMLSLGGVATSGDVSLAAADANGISMYSASDPLVKPGSKWSMKTEGKDNGFELAVLRDATSRTEKPKTALHATLDGKVIIPGELCDADKKCIGVKDIIDINAKLEKLLLQKKKKP